MRVVLFLLLALITGFATALAEVIVEIDLDGVQGNGPDTAWVSVGDTVAADVWFVGDLCLFSVAVEACNPEGALVFQSFRHYMTGWTMTPPFSEDLGCWVFQSTTFNFDCAWEPFRYGTARYLAATDNTIASLTVDVEDSAWYSDAFQTGFVEGFIGAAVGIGTVGAEPSSWGSIKTLFR